MRPPRLPPVREGSGRGPWSPRWTKDLLEGLEGAVRFFPESLTLWGGRTEKGEVWWLEVKEPTRLLLRPGGLRDSGVQAALRGAAQVLSLEAGPAFHLPSTVLEWAVETWIVEVTQAIGVSFRLPKTEKGWQKLERLVREAGQDPRILLLLRQAVELPEADGPLPVEVAKPLEALGRLLEGNFPQEVPFVLSLQQWRGSARSTERTETALVPFLVVEEERAPWEDLYWEATRDFFEGNWSGAITVAGAWEVEDQRQARRLGEALRLVLELLDWVASAWGVRTVGTWQKPSEPEPWRRARRVRRPLPPYHGEPPGPLAETGEEAVLD